MSENFTREERLVGEIPVKGLLRGPVGRLGYEVIVLEQMGGGGNRFYCSLQPGETLDLKGRLFRKFTALAVDIRSGRSFRIERAFAVHERVRAIKVQTNVRYRVIDATKVAMGHVDPLGELRAKVISTINRELARHKEASITSTVIEQIIRSIGNVDHLGLMVEDAEVINFASDAQVIQKMMEVEADLHIQSRQHDVQLQQTQERNTAIDLTDIRTLMQHYPDMIPQIFKMFTDREQQTLQLQQNLVTQAIDAYIKQKHAVKADVDPAEIARIMRQFAGKNLSDGGIIWDDESSSDSSTTDINLTDLRLDAAVPDRIVEGEIFDLAVAVRRLSSPLLAEEGLKLVKSGEIQILSHKSQPYVHLRLQVNAPGCKIHGKDTLSFLLWLGQDSSVFHFHLTPKRQGKISIIVIVYQEDDALGSTRISTKAYEQIVGSVQIKLKSQPIKPRIYPTTQLIDHLSRRLQKLREIQAVKGINTEPHILIEIEDIEAKLNELQELG